jgi:hypothetical protein
MTADADFRHLLLKQKLQAYVQALNNASLDPTLKDVFAKLTDALGELSRMVVKEEGFIVSQL